MQNIMLCFPELGRSRQKRLLLRNFIETGKSAFELGVFWLDRSRRPLRLIKRIEGEDAWRDALKQGRGGIAFTPHMGAWELALLYGAQRYKATGMYRPSRLGLAVDRRIKSWRQRCGARMVPANAQGIRALLKALQKGEVIGILPDQNPVRGEGVFAPFFAQPAYTMTLLSRLALRYRVPVFAVYTERLSWARGYKVHFLPAPEIGSADTIENSVVMLNRVIERIVRQLPGQYLWTYKRFKVRPPGEAKLY